MKIVKELERGLTIHTRIGKVLNKRIKRNPYWVLLRPPAAVGGSGFQLWPVLRLKIPFLTSTTIPKPKHLFCCSAPQQFVFWFGFSTMVTSYAWNSVWQMFNVILTFRICQNFPKNSVLVFEFLSILLVFFVLLFMFGTIASGRIASTRKKSSKTLKTWP